MSLVRRFDKLLIANRGEIACRIIRTAKRMGLTTVVVLSDADRDAMHVDLADEAVLIGPAPAKDSYLHIEAIIDAARTTGAEAIHPGYGFLSENAEFAQACADAGLVFVGPSAATIRLMGSKSAAKALMESSGVPVVPGYHGEDQSLATLQSAADAVGYPVLIKASAGGGGRGMRVVGNAGELAEASRKRQARGGCGIRQRPGPDREIRRQAAAYRSAGVRRHPRQRGVAVRARMHAAASPPEGGGGGAGDRHHARAARRDGGCGAGRRPGGRLCRRRHRRVHRRRGRVLFHRNEHAPAGRASRHRDDHRSRSRGVAVAGRVRRIVAAAPGRDQARRAMRSRRGFMPRTPTKASCRRPGPSASGASRRGRAFASIPAFGPAMWSRPTTMRCWRS